MTGSMRKQDLHQLEPWLWEIPATYRKDMRVPARVYTTERMLDSILGDRSLEQLVNVATLPGLQRYVIAMPDVHEGYGFPIGGVAAVDAKSGVISPGGIGYDINCGVRLLRSDATLDDVKPALRKLAHSLAREIPSGVGRGGPLKLAGDDFDRVLAGGQTHPGSRGLGRQVATDYIRAMTKAMPKYGIELPDRELACAPLDSPEGRRYLQAMSAAANFAWANRQIITAGIRRAWRRELGDAARLDVLYDVAHNVAKSEEYDGRRMVVHRKGATRAFPAAPGAIPGSQRRASEP